MNCGCSSGSGSTTAVVVIIVVVVILILIIAGIGGGYGWGRVRREVQLLQNKPVQLLTRRTMAQAQAAATGDKRVVVYMTGWVGVQDTSDFREYLYPYATHLVVAFAKNYYWNGSANSDGTNNYDQLRQTNILTIGKSYKLTITPSNQSGNIRFTVNNDGTNLTVYNDLSSPLEFYFVNGSNFRMYFDGTETFNCDFEILILLSFILVALLIITLKGELPLITRCQLPAGIRSSCPGSRLIGSWLSI